MVRLTLLLWCIAAVTAPALGGQSGVRVHTLVEELRIASSPSAPLTNVAGVVPLADGRIVVADAHSGLLRVFDSAGRVLQTLSGRGSAPGALAGTVQAIGRSGDELWVQDSEMRVRYVLFDAALEPIGHVPTPARTATYFGLLRGRVTVGAVNEGGREQMVLGDAMGRMVGPLLDVAPRPQAVDVVVSGQRITIDSPFRSPTQVIVSQDGDDAAVVSGDETLGGGGGAIGVTRVLPDGYMIGPSTVRLTPRAMSVAVADSILAEWVQRLPYAASARSQVRVPAFAPAFTRVEHYARLELWLSGAIDNPDWVVIDSLGAPRVRVRTPPGFRLYWSTTSHLWGTLTDAAGAVAIVRYRLVDSR